MHRYILLATLTILVLGPLSSSAVQKSNRNRCGDVPAGDGGTSRSMITDEIIPAPPPLPDSVRLRCGGLKTMEQRVRCRLKLSKKEVQREDTILYLPEECRVISDAVPVCGGVDVKSDQQRCIERYRSLQPCLEKSTISERIACAENVFQLGRISNINGSGWLYVRDCVEACDPRGGRGCCSVRGQGERVDHLVKFWMDNLVMQMNTTRLKKQQIATFIMLVEKTKQAYNTAKALARKEELVRRVWNAWIKLSRSTGSSAEFTADDILRDLRGAYRQ